MVLQAAFGLCSKRSSQPLILGCACPMRTPMGKIVNNSSSTKYACHCGVQAAGGPKRKASCLSGGSHASGSTWGPAGSACSGGSAGSAGASASSRGTAQQVALRFRMMLV